MITITYAGGTFTCDKAYKGLSSVFGYNFVHLVDASGNLTAAFDNLDSFDGFTISGGSWSEPAAPNKCSIAVIGADGRIYKGGHTCEDIPAKASDLNYTEVELTWDPSYGGSTVGDYNIRQELANMFSIQPSPISHVGQPVNIWVASETFLAMGSSAFRKVTDYYLDDTENALYVETPSNIDSDVNLYIKMYY